jgi:hypothetical protein
MRWWVSLGILGWFTGGLFEILNKKPDPHHVFIVFWRCGDEMLSVFGWQIHNLTAILKLH